MRRVLLDDCLAAVDSHVARHVFGMLLRMRFLPRNRIILQIM